MNSFLVPTLTTASSTNNASSSNNPPGKRNAHLPRWGFLSLVTSYNLPRFDPLASWNTNAITFATSGTVGGYPYDVFVNTNNTVFVPNRESSRVLIWAEGQSVPTRNITTRLVYPYSIFVTVPGDIYVDNGYSNQRVDVWKANAVNATSAMFVKRICYDLFVDIANTLYCSMYDQNQVVATSLNSNSNIWTVAAGSDCAGSTSNRLSNPWGIFVDFNLNLYVADFSNNRIQLFSSGQVTGTTVVGASAPGTITLYGPTDVILDGDGYLFIVDCYNHRIIGSGPNGYRCIASCAGSGSGTNQLTYPVSMSFDSHGNLFVADKDNHRIQKFNLVPMGNLGKCLAEILDENSTRLITCALAFADIYFNQPQFCPSITWYPEAITIANVSIAGVEPNGLFVGRDNTLYIANREASRLEIWLEGSIRADRNITAGLSQPKSVIATNNGDIYIDNGVSYLRIDRWTSNRTSGTTAMTIVDECYNMFLDRSNFLYCAATFSHQVVKRWLGDNSTASARIAGTGGAATTPNTLYYPTGVYVDVNFNLYVADCGNNRIQLFGLGQSDATTVAGAGAPATITLSCPTSVTLDANGYLFMTDTYNGRVIGSGPLGYRCIFGCSGTGSSPSQLYYGRGFSFDNQGNIFVIEQYNYRVQKILLATNSCSEYIRVEWSSSGHLLVLGLSYNQPRLCADATWTVNGTTLLTNASLGVTPYSIFLDGINTIYVIGRARNMIFVWPPGTSSLTTNITGSFNSSSSLFVSGNGDIYIDNGFVNGRVDRWIFNSSSIVPVLRVNGSCSGLFVDQNNSLYCSLGDFHCVVRTFLGNDPNSSTVAAGTGLAGSSSTMLNSPQGIYVDMYFTLYVADCGNDRVQSFAPMQSTGVTVAGNGSSATMPLDCPTSIAMDADGYLFIVDSFNHRIIGSGPYGFRCVIGCSGTGSAASQLSFPQSMAFDSYGNMFVTDRNNNRVQRYMFQKTACGKWEEVFSDSLPWTIWTWHYSCSNEKQYRRRDWIGGFISTHFLFLTVASTTVQSTVISTTNLRQTSTIPSTQATVITTARLTSSVSISAQPATGIQTTIAPGINTVTSSMDSSGTTTAASSTNFNPHTGISETSQSVGSPGSTSSETTTVRSTTTTGSTVPNTLKIETSRTTANPEGGTSETVQNASVSSLGSTAPATASVSLSITAVSTLTQNKITMASTMTTGSVVNAVHGETTATASVSIPGSTGPATSTPQTDSTSVSPTASSSAPNQSKNCHLLEQTICDCYCVKQGCLPPTITLVPDGSTWLSPVQYRRRREFSITSSFEFHCNRSLSISKEWIITSCNRSVCSLVLDLPGKVNRRLSELYIPSRTLAVGVYQLTLHVQLMDRPSVRASSSIYVQVLPSDIVANLFQLGTSLVTQGSAQELLLNPGRYSVDPDEDAFDASVRIVHLYWTNRRGVIV